MFSIKRIAKAALVYLAIGLITLVSSLINNLRKWSCHYDQNGQSWSESFTGPFSSPGESCKRMPFENKTLKIYVSRVVLWPIAISVDN